MKNIYIITPSWLMKKKNEFVRGIRTLERMGFNVINRRFPAKLPSDKAKATQLHNVFLQKDPDIILAQRGGYSSMRMLPYVNFNLIKKHPKTLAGFSDMSTLLNTVYERTGIITLHSPMVINFCNASRFTMRSFSNAVNNYPVKDLFEGAPVRIYCKGRAEGTLKGGNLVTLTALIGTEWETSTDNAVIFLEDVDEKLHGVDRYLTHWILAGKFTRIKGLILGDFRGIKNTDVYNIITGQMKVAFPVVHCPYIGHVKNKITLPVGARVELNTYKKELKIIKV